MIGKAAPMVALAFGCIVIGAAEVRGDDQFRDHVAPLLSRRCVGCHNDRQRAGEFSLQTAAAALADGHLLPGDPAGSHLLELITPQDGKAEMPKDADPLSDQERQLIHDWIRDGARWPADFRLEEPRLTDFEWWSYQRLERPSVPPSKANAPADSNTWPHETGETSAIDRFVLAKLHEKGLTHSPPADRRSLIRRVTYDLTGLPPTPEDVAAFVANTDPQAYEQLVDRLLDSPQYGEHWARHWLDVAKYADTCGYDKDKLRPNAWPYRDYVIRSLNSDRPYGQFVQQQIAGDVLFPDDPDGVVALGFIAAGPWDFIGHVEVSETKIDGQVARNLDRDDMVSGAINTFCSVTIQCARCHNHKFDPITQEHYYGLQSVFAAVDRANREFDIDPATGRRRRELADHLQSFVAARTAIEAEITRLGGNELAVASEQLAELEKNLTNGDATLLDRIATAKAKRDEIYAAQLAKPYDDAGQPGPAVVSGQANSTIQDRLRAYTEQITKLESELQTLPPQQVVYAAATHFKPEGNFHPTGGKPRDVFVLARGEVTQPGAPAVPGVLPLSENADSQFAADLDEAQRRAKFAEWLVDPNNPLVWRSIVNRVWQYHFGEGIVATPNDFGRMGEPPTHPELLDWLAVEFRDGGQSLKTLHRMIVTSKTYQQASANSASQAAIDSSNQFLWRANRRRLTAEELRDSILTVSGAMNFEMGGPGYYLFALEKTEHSPHFEYHKFDPADKASHRRTIYRFIARSQPNPYMTTLDCADSSQSTPRRNETLTSLQALTLLNNKFNLVMAEEFAARLAREAGDLESQVHRAMNLIVQRQPTATETDELVSYAQAHGMANLCRLLFNLSEFVFVD